MALAHAHRYRHRLPRRHARDPRRPDRPGPVGRARRLRELLARQHLRPRRDPGCGLLRAIDRAHRGRHGRGADVSAPSVAMAQQAMSAAAAARGRFALGIGLSHQMVIDSMLGMSWDKPYPHCREYLAVLGPLLRARARRLRRQQYRVHASLPCPAPRRCPCCVAALAPKMLALTGRETDGTITWMTGPQTIRDHTAPRHHRGRRGGRARRRRASSAGLPIAVTHETSAAREDRVAHLPDLRPPAVLSRHARSRGIAAGPADVAIVGDEAAVGEQIEASGGDRRDRLPGGAVPRRRRCRRRFRTRGFLAQRARQALRP